ncbi:MAG: nicotinate-nucleotide adenylyltransferase [Lachnospiraceae bacterium]|jgi:nicotinate-nucleotide adenylyltransferase|nr:nicotinate-nucleotide adenylyltransferase [Lachnospiraceae bacterium]
MKRGILGGTFNPIHNGHMMLAFGALKKFKLDEVRFLPNGNPPHKQNERISTSVEARMEMVQLAIDEVTRSETEKAFVLDDYEGKRAEISCTCDTLEYFSKIYSDDALYFIIGADSLEAMDTWVHPERIFPLCTVLAAYRDDLDTPKEMYNIINHLKRKYDGKIKLLRVPLLPISSHEIRRKIARGESVRGLLPESVEEYIIKNKLYQE